MLVAWESEIWLVQYDKSVIKSNFSFAYGLFQDGIPCVVDKFLSDSSQNQE